jgi:PAS domain S-box-containing protein
MARDSRANGNPPETSIAQALQRSEERFRRVVESALSAMVMTRPTGQIELVNAQTERLFGYPREELIGQSVEILMPERFRGHHPQLRVTYLADPQTRPMGAGRDLFGLRKDGREFPVEIGLNPIETDDGIMVLSTIVDLSARKRLEDRLRLVVEAAPSAMVMVGALEKIEMANAEAERLFGYSRQELLGQPLAMLIPEGFSALHAPLSCRSFDRSPSRPLGSGRNFSALRKDGSELTVEIGLNPVETDDGPMVLAVIADISERAAGARALARSEAEFRASFEGTVIGRLLADPQSRRIRRANSALGCMLGYKPKELIGRFCSDLVWHEDRTEDAADHAHLLSGEVSSITRDERYVRIDGSPVWVRVSATVVQPSGVGDGPIVVMAIQDIDTQHKAEIALRTAKQELEQVVQERTNALGQRDLLLREVYHRVKNNLQLVDSLLMMQRRKIDDPQAREALLSLRGRIFALGLVHQQLMGSADLKTFDIVPFLDDLSKNILEGGGTSGVDISVDACTLDVGLDFAVPLGLLVTELVTNSLKHAFPNGTGLISVVLRNDAGGKLVLVVSDNGVGAPDSLANGETTRGLGTRIVANLVAQLDGTLEIRNGVGMTTEVRLPMPARP